MWHFPLAFLLLVSSSGANADKRINKYVSTQINAKWNETPIILEVAEYLADENPRDFWKYVDTIVDSLEDIFVSGTEAEQYENAIKFASPFLSSVQIPVLKLALSLRVHSVKVEMFCQMAQNRKNLRPDCPAFADVNSKITCVPDDLENLIDEDDWDSKDVYDIDHHYLGTENSKKKVVLYGQLGTKEFAAFHKKLRDLVESKKIGYILRHYVKDRPDRKMRLSGYGVELQMKSTEYKATDDSDDIKEAGDENEVTDDGIEEVDGINFAILKKLYPDDKAELEKFQADLLDTSHEIGAMKVWQFQELSHQAAERIMNAPPSQALDVLTDIAQNFPMQAKSLIRTKVSNDMKNEIKQNQVIFFNTLHIQPSDTALFINGLFFDLETVDVLSLLESLRSELRVIEALHKIGFNNKKLNTMLAMDLSGDSDSQDFAIDIRESAIIWVNDIEKDSRYSRWPSSLMSLLRPTFPSTLRNIRRNLYNLVLIIDPLSESSKSIISFVSSIFSTYSAPIRVGFLFITNPDNSATGLTDASVAVNNAYQYFAAVKNPKTATQSEVEAAKMKAFEFLQEVGKYVGHSKVDVVAVRRAILALEPSAKVNDILGEDSEHDIGRKLTSDFIKAAGFKKFPQALLNGVPLSTTDLDADAFTETVFAAVMSQTPLLQKAVYTGKLTDDDDVVEWLMNQPNVMPRLNERVLKTEKNKWLNLIGTVQENKDYTTWSPQDTAAWLLENTKYLSIPARTTVRHLYSFWIVVDLENESGRKLLREALKYLRDETNTDVRLSIIVNGEDDIDSESNIINKMVLATLETKSHKEAINSILRLIDEKTVKLVRAGNFNMEDEGVKMGVVKEQDFLLGVHRFYAKSVLELGPSVRAIVCNGRVIGPLDEDEEFASEEFALLERFSQSTYGDKLLTNLMKLQTLDEDDYEENKVTDNMIMQIVSLLVPRPETRSRFDISVRSDQYSSINIPAANPDEVAFNIMAIVDPVSRGAQKLGPILSTLQKSLNCNIKVYLNCIEKNSDMPLKSFYRFVLEPELQFSGDGQLSGAMAKFTKLPTTSLLTQQIHAPENWLVEVVQSVYDLDNIKLENVAMGVHSEFELEHLLLEGHCFEALMGNAPRGLQITLGTESQPLMVDTIVMANLGYFQLKASPGEWILQLRQGRSAEIYDITSVGGQDVIQNGNDVKVLISTLRSHVLKLKVSKKPDKADMDLLWEDEKSSGLWNSISRTFTSNDESGEPEEKLNIFSLASGHLYERFLKIMMLSVMKHTKTPVKFWLLKNYLSPTVKNFLPHMAKEYGFEYEFVQYKWPRWLHQQTEKQRTIWGYKILFLDVLFPLDVKKIIFVDADQVVRADLKELANLDLEGAPYAYPPFCDSRTEMDGFRFWRQGYWRNHLQGRNYHISALYVVDLKRFRRIAAGDRLRGQYQALSQDPNSLSNLDQDLPNNMIHQVAIKTLPQEWLWCETWCDDRSKKYAKTIDLCNNPMTKEAKLQAAMRILPEWTGYDEEIRTLQHRIENVGEHLEREDKEEKDSDDAAKHEEL